jgi:NADPH-dependent 2,4-dienoyl-CoA reductase/sulfur reductase-like enzyme
MSQGQERIVVVGGNASGMSASSQALRTARRLGRDLEVVVLERGHWTSYSACGIPYWVAGDVDEADDLIARSAEAHRENGIDVRLQTEALQIDTEACVVTIRDLQTGRTDELRYDQLIYAAGAVPNRPPIPGIDAGNIHGLQTLDEGQALLDALGTEPKNAVVVGAGYIGVEIAEAMHRRGLSTRVIDARPEPMATLDHDMGALVHRAMEGMGIDVVTSSPVDGFDVDAAGNVASVTAGGTEYPADLVVLGLGVRPNTGLAEQAGLPLGDRGGVRTTVRMNVVGMENVWAAGDCVESFDRVSQSWRPVPLGTHANKQGRVLGTNLAGGYATFPGVVRTAVSKVCELEIARSGLREIDAKRAGFRYVVGSVRSRTQAGYMPGSRRIVVKVLAEQGTGRLLGVQIVGAGPGAAKRIDGCAIALWNRMTAGELAMTDLSYAPPFSPVWDPVQIAARRAAEAAGVQ